MAVAATALLPFAAQGQYQTTLTPNLIQTLESGWGADTFFLTVDQPIVNPASCPFPTGYALELAGGGYKTNYAAALLAFSMGRRVLVSVRSSAGSCANGHPVIYGIKILQP